MMYPIACSLSTLASLSLGDISSMVMESRERYGVLSDQLKSKSGRYLMLTANLLMSHSSSLNGDLLLRFACRTCNEHEYDEKLYTKDLNGATLQQRCH